MWWAAAHLPSLWTSMMEGSWGSQENPWESSPARWSPACLEPAGLADPPECQDSPWRVPTITVGVHLAEDLLSPLLWCWLIFWHLHYRRNHLIDCLCDRQEQRAGKKHNILMQGYDNLVTETGRKYPGSTSKICSLDAEGCWVAPGHAASLFSGTLVYEILCFFI